MNLSNNTVLITGGSSGIGFAFAERFLAAGSQVVICELHAIFGRLNAPQA